MLTPEERQVVVAKLSTCLRDIFRLMVRGHTEVTAVVGQASILLEVVPPHGEVGKVIGKGGRVASAIRTVVRAIASEQLGNNYDVTLNIVDEKGRSRGGLDGEGP